MSESDHVKQFRDRSLGLAIFGSLQILIGLGCLALIPLTLVAIPLSPAIDFGVVAPSLLLYALAAAAFILLGAGSIRARLWAQSLSLSIAWLWLITGVCTLALLWLAAPSLWGDLAAGAGLDGGSITFVIIGINLFLSAIYVLLPATMVLFFRSPHVIATCLRRDAKPTWASRCPQQLLSLAVTFVLCGLSIIAVPSYGYVFPCFGVVLSGGAGAVCWAIALILCFALAWGTIRREPWAWWTAVVSCILAAISSVVTFAWVDREVVFSAMDLAPDQLLIMEYLWPGKPWIHIVFWLALWGSLLAYLMVVRPLFGDGGREGVRA